MMIKIFFYFLIVVMVLSIIKTKLNLIVNSVTVHCSSTITKLQLVCYKHRINQAASLFLFRIGPFNFE